MHDSTRLEDRPVEEALRRILYPLDRQLALVSAFFPLALVTLVPAFFFTLWLGIPLAGKCALVMSAGAICALVALHLAWEILASRLALRRFNRRFPLGSPDRLIALRILDEMQTPSKAEEKLRSALAGSSPDRIIRHRRSDKGEFPDHVRIDSPAEAGSPHSTVGPRPGGYYDYIPLEPRRRDQQGPPNS